MRQLETQTAGCSSGDRQGQLSHHPACVTRLSTRRTRALMALGILLLGPHLSGCAPSLPLWSLVRDGPVVSSIFLLLLILPSQTLVRGLPTQRCTEAPRKRGPFCPLWLLAVRCSPSSLGCSWSRAGWTCSGLSGKRGLLMAATEGRGISGVPSDPRCHRGDVLWGFGDTQPSSRGKDGGPDANLLLQLILGCTPQLRLTR